MITPAQLEEMLREETPAATLREKLELGLKHDTEEEREHVRGTLLVAMSGKIDVFQVVLNVACKELIVPSTPTCTCLLLDALKERSCAAAMAVVERMRKDGLLATSSRPFWALYGGHRFEREVEEAVISVIDASLFHGISGDNALSIAIRILSGTGVSAGVRAVNALLKIGPSLEERMKAGLYCFHYVHVAAESSSLKMLQHVHELLPLLPGEPGSRGKLEDYARAIERAAVNRHCRDEVLIMIKYLVDQAGDEKVFRLCNPTFLLTSKAHSAIEWLVERAPELVEAACKHPMCLTLLITGSLEAEALMEHMTELVDRKVLCEMMQQVTILVKESRCLRDAQNWRSTLKPVHDAVPECMDDLRWMWLVEAIKAKSYEDVQYLLGMCTREHLIMQTNEGDTAYSLATEDTRFPQDLLEGLKVVPLVKRAVG